jgi:hypothetical protein
VSELARVYISGGSVVVVVVVSFLGGGDSTFEQQQIISLFIYLFIYPPENHETAHKDGAV